MIGGRLKAVLPGASAVVIALVGWEIVSRSHLVNAVLLPPPSSIFGTLAATLSSRTLLAPLSHTLALMFGGYAIACLLGVSIGIAMGLSDAVYGLLEPLIELLRPIPKPALIPPLYLFLGIGVETMLVIVILGAFFPILINTIQGVRGVSPTLIATARTYRLSRPSFILKIVLPGALPMIATGMRISLGLALTLVIVAEMMVSDNGIGFLILDKQRAFQMEQMYSWVLLLAAIGVALNALFEWLEHRALPWRGAS